jgi:ribulose-phosphate 3-epimerase
VSRPIEIVPSVLSADFTHLGDDVRAVASGGADRIQIDVMDGHFVPNLTMGPLVLEAIRRVTTLPLEVQLMVANPELLIPLFLKAGADYIQVHVESTHLLYRAVMSIREGGAKAAVAINPGTPAEALREVVPYVSQINVMTVEPGFGGQTFIGTSPDRIRRVRDVAPDVEIEVDGGIDARSAPLVVAAGASVLVAGTAVFGHPGGIAAGIQALRDAVG